MNHFNDIAEILQSSFKDYRLDKEEKHALHVVLSSLTEEERRFARNRAFDLVKAEVKRQPESTGLILSWLEKSIKTMDLSKATALVADAFFSPGDDCYREIINRCALAKNSIDVCVFTISDNRLRDALFEAHTRDNVKVRILTDNDKSEDRGSDIDELISKGVEVRMDRSSNHMHHKFAIFDQTILLNGSFNWTRSATERNQENITIQDDQRLVAQFSQQFELLWNKFG